MRETRKSTVLYRKRWVDTDGERVAAEITAARNPRGRVFRVHASKPSERMEIQRDFPDISIAKEYISRLKDQLTSYV